MTFGLDIPVHSSSHPHAWVSGSVNLRICSPQPFHYANTSSRTLCNQANTRNWQPLRLLFLASGRRPPLKAQQLQLWGNSPSLENTENLIPSRTTKPWFKLEGRIRRLICESAPGVRERGWRAMTVVDGRWRGQGGPWCCHVGVLPSNLGPRLAVPQPAVVLYLGLTVPTWHMCIRVVEVVPRWHFGGCFWGANDHVLGLLGYLILDQFKEEWANERLGLCILPLHYSMCSCVVIMVGVYANIFGKWKNMSGYQKIALSLIIWHLGSGCQ